MLDGKILFYKSKYKYRAFRSSYKMVGKHAERTGIEREYGEQDRIG
jgi:hypothetical protein